MRDKSEVLISVEFSAAEQLGNIQNGLAGHRVIDWARGERPDDLSGVKYALVWEFDHDLFDRMPDLEVIFSAGAGVDKIMNNPALPSGVPIVRFVDHTLTTRMSEWVSLQTLLHLRQHNLYAKQQNDKNWVEHPQPQASEINVGIMGLGVLGIDASEKLRALGFNVLGWSRTKKQIEDMTCYDESELDAFLSQCHILIGLLPLTERTTGLFNRDILSKLKTHPVIKSPIFINGGRGKSQVETDIIDCLQDGTLGGASLDVFEQEPLSETSPLWECNNAILTPHVAANSDVEALGKHVAHQISRYEAGEPLEHLVNRELGY